jgi:hypothetical protein
MDTRDIQVTELTKEYVVLNGERIDFDEPFEDDPNMEEFTQWLTNIKGVLDRIDATES